MVFRFSPVRQNGSRPDVEPGRPGSSLSRTAAGVARIEEHEGRHLFEPGDPLVRRALVRCDVTPKGNVVQVYRKRD